MHDKIGVTEASEALDVLMTSKPTYKLWQHLIIGGLASALIQPSAFYGSLIVRGRLALRAHAASPAD